MEGTINLYRGTAVPTSLHNSETSIMTKRTQNPLQTTRMEFTGSIADYSSLDKKRSQHIRKNVWEF
jgi:hypothetical protein